MLTQLGQQLLRLALLRGVAVLHHLVEQLPRAVLVSHFLVRLGEIELGGDFLPFRIGAGGRSARLARSTQVQANGRQVHRSCGLVGFRPFLVPGEVQADVEIETAVRRRGRRLSGFQRLAAAGRVQIEIQAGDGSPAPPLTHDQRAFRGEIAPCARARCRRRRGTEVEVQSAGGGAFGSSSEKSGKVESFWDGVPLRSKSRFGAAAAAAGAAAGAPPPPYSPFCGSIERPRAAALSHSGPEPLVSDLSLSAVCSKDLASRRLA